MKNIVILGSTGSLGRQALEVAKKYKKYFKIIAISANTNEKLLLNQAKKLHISSQNTVLISKKGKNSLKKLSQLKEADIIINVISGIAGIEATAECIKAGKTILLGNKESLVAAGKKIMDLIKKNPSSKIIPLDSEHNAIYEILQKYPNQKIKKIILPCSGGPFLNMKKQELKDITAEKALIHPIWAMGPKITIESATLINKGLEIIEAHYLFKLPLNKIKVHLHPEGFIHGMVEFSDFIIAYASKPDMREHIENALLRSININSPKRNIKKIIKNKFTLKSPDHKNFPGIKIVTKAFKKFKNNSSEMTKFLAIEEKTINKFLQNKIKFTQIFTQLEEFLAS